MDEYKLLKKYNKKEEPTIKKKVISFVNKILICVVLFLTALILTKNKTYKDNIYKYVYSYNLSFSKIEELYKKYFGFLTPKKEDKKSEEVSSTKLTYEKLQEIENGVELKVGKSSAITSLESGIVIFVGDKDDLNDVVIIEQVDATEAWYVGIEDTDLKIYDYVEKSSIIGNSKTEFISLYFKKQGESVDYKNYLF